MGNCCSSKKKDKRYFELNEIDLNQVVIERISDCDICDRKIMLGYDVKSLIDNRRIFVCIVCKNLK